MSKKQKYYVVWNGRQNGVFDSWEACKESVDGFERAQFKSYSTLFEAEHAYNSGYGKTPVIKVKPSEQIKFKNDEIENPVWESISVDAGCLGNPGILEYRGVITSTGEEIFRKGPFENGTQNIGEFLAIVHGLAYLRQKGSNIAVYSDSLTAIGWVKTKTPKTTLVKTESNEKLFELLERGVNWLKSNEYPNKLLKWKTEIWGEIPADFGRK